MRRLSALAAFLAGLLLPGVAQAQSIAVSGVGGTITYGVAGGAPGSVAPPAGRPAAGATGAPGYLATLPAVVFDGTGFCVSTRQAPYPTQSAATAVTDSYDTNWRDLLADYPMCAPYRGGPGPSVAPPGALAATWWQTQGEDRLARPEPWISPGYALAGQPGFLEARMSLAEDFANQTPLGTLLVLAKAELEVDWGDGSGWQGPYDTPGGAWPSGTVTHVWDTVGSYDVTVLARWKASWSLAGQGGHLTGLSTEGSLAGFQVRQLVAVRNR